uniref:Sperm associated antigen 6 n=1 Tax=Nothobranchius furzeri TaxID=105023 RepID=A0A8C6LQC1_NOTFU
MGKNNQKLTELICFYNIDLISLLKIKISDICGKFIFLETALSWDQMTSSQNISIKCMSGVPQLALCLSEESEQHMKAATVWSIGQIGSHTPEHAKAVATANLLPRLLELYMDAGSSWICSKKVLKGILQKSTSPQSLEPLLYDARTSILKHVLCQLSKVLPHDSKARRAEPDSELQKHINTITSCFPEGEGCF